MWKLVACFLKKSWKSATKLVTVVLTVAHHQTCPSANGGSDYTMQQLNRRRVSLPNFNRERICDCAHNLRNR